MNLFVNILVVYLIPLIIYARGKNEYVENEEEHRLSQRTQIASTPESSIRCVCPLVVICRV